MADKSPSQSIVNSPNDDRPIGVDNTTNNNDHIDHHSQLTNGENSPQDNMAEGVDKEVQSVQSAMQLLDEISQDHSDVEESNTLQDQPQTNQSHQDLQNGSQDHDGTLKKEENQPIYDDDQINLDQASQLRAEEREELFQKGTRFKDKGNSDLALRCFMACLKGINNNNAFSLLPQCLHSIATIYFERENFDKAVQFIQAEKLYYETALIMDVSNQEVTVKNDEGANTLKELLELQENEDDEHKTNPLAARAVEFTTLASMCLQNNNPHLALEYCGKATKIRQSIYGESHDITKKTLEYFTCIYASVGKKQYSDALSKYKEAKDKKEPEDDEATAGGNRLRKRSAKHQKQETDDTLENELKDDEYEDDRGPSCFLIMAVILIILVLAILVVAVWCNVTQSLTCPSHNHIWTRVKKTFSLTRRQMIRKDMSHVIKIFMEFLWFHAN
ncbi:uncharacterized protein TRIADDRAFT_61237 [Trichoplax adhaerens]|uniref:Consortin N-terminal domain-containing protein n=1 Tax=Trichoplax adhaerens TaxID=10228 RepID=B3SAF1_TRIAD|nr:predicted protein [Trichoplax adhaerens]EDV20247.1 predicted protein [Trichoplax adhaerens]|eukprot:XP_002117197.1 predicted protein [Trichoplax adhaerens]